MNDKIRISDKDWRPKLTDEQFRVCRKRGTEKPFSGKYNNCKQAGTYHCVCCGSPLFDSSAKYDSGSGWPSFWQPIESDHVTEKADNEFGMQRMEVICSHCDAHLGHVFEDGPQPTGMRYCINSVSLDLKEHDDG